MSSARGTTRQYWVAIRSMVILTVVLGIAYPLVITAIGLLAPSQANGSPITVDGKVVGSSLIGQSFTDTKTGLVLDNGQHILMGCYHESLALLRTFGVMDRLYAPPRPS